MSTGKKATLIQSEIKSKKRVVFNIRQASCLGGSDQPHTQVLFI